MSDAALYDALSRMNVQLHALAAVGAEMTLRHTGQPGDPRLRPLVQAVAGAVHPGLLDGLDPAQEAAALGLLRSFFLDAASLLDNPAARPGWTHTDPAILQSLGRSSRTNVTTIAALAAGRPALAAAIDSPHDFLDVGTGVGQMAIAAATLWPHKRAVGIDLWAPSLAIAHANLADSGVADRVELRSQDVLHLPDRDRFGVAWLPAPFIAEATVRAAIPLLLQALAPGGWLVVGLFNIPADPLAAAVARLRVVRSGGHPWLPQDIAELMRDAGFDAVEIPQVAGTPRVIGRRA